MTITSEDTVYIAGPMTGRPDNNRKIFAAAERYLKYRYNCRVLNPARQADGLSYCEYMALAMQDLDKATAIVLLPGYIASTGANVERAVARRIGLAIFNNIIPPEALQ